MGTPSTLETAKVRNLETSSTMHSAELIMAEPLAKTMLHCTAARNRDLLSDLRAYVYQATEHPYEQSLRQLGDMRRDSRLIPWRRPSYCHSHAGGGASRWYGWALAAGDAMIQNRELIPTWPGFHFTSQVADLCEGVL